MYFFLSASRYRQCVQSHKPCGCSRILRNSRHMAVFVVGILYTVIWGVVSIDVHAEGRSAYQSNHEQTGHYSDELNQPQSPLKNPVEKRRLLNSAQSGQLFLFNDNEQGDSALHIRSDFDIRVHGMLAEIRQTQVFHNDSEFWAEGVYVLPLPEKAAVHRLEMTIGERTIVGEIQEKTKARKTYLAAKKSGRKAALLEQERPNLFTQSVANVAPHEKITVTITYLEQARYDQGEFSLRIPMTLTPRYLAGSSVKKTIANAVENTNTLDTGITVTEKKSVETDQYGWGYSADQARDAERISPPFKHLSSVGYLPAENSGSGLGVSSNMAVLRVELDTGMPLASVKSPLHEISVDKQQGKHLIELTHGHTAMNRDFVLQWIPVIGQKPEVGVFTQRLDNNLYASLMVLPPIEEQSVQLLPRDIVLIIDTSGSMSGVSIRQAKASLQWALKNLKSQDRFNIVAFHSTYSMAFPHSVDANAINLSLAQQFVQKLEANGGTEMLPPLEAVLEKAPENQYLKQVVFITDGSVSNEQALFSLIHSKLADTRLFTVGIGSAPNSFFMRKAAQFGRGTYTYISREQDVESKMARLFQKLESPVLTALNIAWPDDMAVEALPAKLPDLYLGEPLIINAKLTPEQNQPIQNLSERVMVSGYLNGEHWQRYIPITGAENRNGISTLWGREKIATLLDARVMGKPAETVREEVLAVALEHQLISPFTSFVAVEQRRSRPENTSLQTGRISNLLPQGTPVQTVRYPQTATPARWYMLLGSFSLLLFLIINVTTKRAFRSW